MQHFVFRNRWIGPIDIKHAPTVIRRFITYAIAIDPDTSEYEHEDTTHDNTFTRDDQESYLKMIWFDCDGKDLIDSKII